MLVRIVDYLKSNQITALFTNLNANVGVLEHTDVGISSLIDTWLLLRDIELNGERNRGMYVLKSRGMAHSNQIREFILTDHGIELRDVYVGAKGVLTGSARVAQEANENAELLTKKQEIERIKREIERKRKALEAHIMTLRIDFESEEAEAVKVIETEKETIHRLEQDKTEMAESRKADNINLASNIFI
jgi:circadian clock protein KaiC